MINQLIWLLIYVVCIGLLCWLIYWVVDTIPIPDPINRFIKIAVVVIGVIALILLLLKIPSAGAASLRERCEPHIPYYMKGDYGPGQHLANIFLGPFTLVGAIMAAPVTAGTGHLGQSLCTPIAQIGMWRNREHPHVEPYR